MKHGRSPGLVPVLTFGVAAFLVACLSILDMFLPRPYDGVILDPDRSELVVRSLAPDSGAAAAGILAGRPDRRRGPRGRAHTARGGSRPAAARHRRARPVPSRAQRGADRGRRSRSGRDSWGPPRTLYACFSGFLFFFIGLYVLVQTTDEPQGGPSYVFFTLCTLFLLLPRLPPAARVLLVDRRRRAEHGHPVAARAARRVPALLPGLPAAPEVDAREPRRDVGRVRRAGCLRATERFVNASPAFFRLLYLLPPLFFVATLLVGSLFAVRIRLVSGAPISSWVLMGDYLVLGLLALLGSLLRAEEGRERRQIAAVFIGTVAGHHAVHRVRRGAPVAAPDRPLPLLGRGRPSSWCR